MNCSRKFIKRHRNNFNLFSFIFDPPDGKNDNKLNVKPNEN